MEQAQPKGIATFIPPQAFALARYLQNSLENDSHIQLFQQVPFRKEPPLSVRT